jgi:hypothetical protein
MIRQFSLGEEYLEQGSGSGIIVFNLSLIMEWMLPIFSKISTEKFFVMRGSFESGFCSF